MAVGGPHRLEVKSLGGREVWLLEPTADIHDQWEAFQEWARGRDDAPWRAKLASLLLCDEKGVPLFTAADVPKLGKMSAAVLTEIGKAGLKLLAVTDSEVEAAAGN